MKPNGRLFVMLAALMAWLQTIDGRADSTDRFLGGVGDGAAAFSSKGYTDPEGGELGRYVGGGGYDGYGVRRGVGYSPPVGGEDGRFLGGGGYDGYGVGRDAGFVPAVGGDLARYLGGGGFDGYERGSLAGYTAPGEAELGRFVGGAYDGHAAIVMADFSNPLNGDMDGDGVPDWWEGFHYHSLALADAGTDIDGDGMGSLDEYTADTNPRDSASVFRVLGLEVDDLIRIEFGRTSIHRSYWIEVSPRLGSGDWTRITFPSVVGSGALMELSTPNVWNGSAFFRVRVMDE